MPLNSIDKKFREIKALFFPRWDQAGTWTVRTSSRRTVHGYCDLDRKVIEIVKPCSDGDEQDLLFIHEIGHAVASGGHGIVWRRRMEQAAIQASSIGREPLAELLRREIVGYKEASELGIGTTAHAYQLIEDWLLDNPSLTEKQVCSSLAAEHGMLDSEVSDAFKRWQKVFQRAKRRSLEQQAFHERMKSQI